jgi:hypothetical protein
LACAVATVKFGMFGFDAAMRSRSNAKAGCDRRIAVTNTIKAFIVMSRVVHHRYRLIFSICYRTKAFAPGAWPTQQSI